MWHSTAKPTANLCCMSCSQKLATVASGPYLFTLIEGCCIVLQMMCQMPWNGSRSCTIMSFAGRVRGTRAQN